MRFKSKKRGCTYKSHKTIPGKVWHFLAHEDSLASFVVDAIIIILIGKFLIYPGIGLALGTDYPLVAVISSSMDHDADFDEWWQTNGKWYEEHNITKKDFEEFTLKKGFHKGDVLIIKGAKLKNLKVGDIIVYSAPGRRDPIIHRIISIENNTLSTKGDANQGQLQFEKHINEYQIAGKATVLIPKIGWLKVGLIELFR